MAFGLKKASPIAAMQSGVAKLRARRDDLANQLQASKTAVVDCQGRLESILIDGTDENELGKVEAALADAERRTRALAAALGTLDNQVAAEEAAVTEAIRRAAADDAVADVRARHDKFKAEAATFIAAAQQLMPAAEALSATIWAARELGELARILSAEVPVALARVENDLEHHCGQLLSGAVRPQKPAVPEVGEPKPTPAIMRVFTLSNVRWIGGGAIYHQYVEMPEQIATRALEFDHAIPVNDGRTKELFRMTGYLSPPLIPAPLHFIDLEAPDLQRRRPMARHDQAAATIQVVTMGGAAVR